MVFRCAVGRFGLLPRAPRYRGYEGKRSGVLQDQAWLVRVRRMAERKGSGWAFFLMSDKAI